MDSLYSAFFWVVSIVFLYRWVRIAFHPDLRHVPGPFLNRFSRLPLKYAICTGHRADYIHTLHQRYGHFVRIAPNEVAVSDIQAVKLIHRSGTGFLKADWYSDTHPTKKSDDDLCLFQVTNPRTAAERRKLYHRSGSRQALKAWEPQVREYTGVAVSKIKQDIYTIGHADIWKWFTFMATDLIGVVAFGESFGLLKTGVDTTLIHDLEKIMMLTGLGVEFNLWLFVKYFPVPGIGNFKTILARMLEEGYRAVAATKNSSKGSSHTLFSKMVPEDGSEAPLSDSVVASEAIGDIVAGSDTSVAGIVYMIYAVLGHPDIKKKLEEELATCSDTPSWDELEGKQYLNWVIDEGLRLYPPAPSSLPRKVPDKGAVLGGYKLPGGCVVSTQALTIQRDPVAFPNPEEFIPERWEKVTPEMKDHFVAFGGSMRSCVGQHLARLELLFAIQTFFRECPDVVMAKSADEKCMERLDFFTAKPRGGKVEVMTKGSKTLTSRK